MKRVLILSQPLHNNYGGLLQAFALQKVVKSLGFDVVTNKAKLKPNREITFKKIIVFCYNKAKNIAKKILRYKSITPQISQVISQNTRKFIDKFIDNQHIENLSDEIIEQFDIFIVGSDQVFRKRWSPVTKYFLEDLQDRSDKIKHKTGLDAFEIMPEENYTAISKCIFPSVSKWLAGFRDAKFVVTDSFHGTVFSIIFQKPFIVIGNQIRGLSRMSSLLTIFGLKERLISTESELKESLFENIDYEKVNDIKIQWKNKSLDFLKNNL